MEDLKGFCMRFRIRLWHRLGRWLGTLTTAWSRSEAGSALSAGRLAFRMQPLGEVLQQLNRYSSKPLVIADPGMPNSR